MLPYTHNCHPGDISWDLNLENQLSQHLEYLSPHNHTKMISFHSLSGAFVRERLIE